MRPTSKRTYTAQQREDAVKLSGEKSIAKAATELGIPQGTVGYWVYMARKKSRDAARVADGGAVAEGTRQGEQKPVGAAEADRDEKRARKTAHVKTQTTTAPEPVKSKRTLVARTYLPSAKAQALELADKVGISEASRQLGISRFSIYDWRRKARLASESPDEVSPVVGEDVDPGQVRDARILEEWEKHRGLGPSQIRNQLRREGMQVSVHTVRVVMEANGYVTPRTKRTEVHDRRYEAVRPNQLWHADFLSRYVNKQLIRVLFFIDDYSRFIVGWNIFDQERAAAVIETFQGAVSRYGRPETMMSDGGSGFWSWRGIAQFTRLLDELSVDQLIAKVPQVNGKLEVLNANVQKELFNTERFFDLGEAHARLGHWVSFYNFRRTHHALGGILVPADRYFGRADEVRAQIEAGRSPEGIGEPLALSERLVDLLRVSSRAGKLEVHLMGEQVYPSSAK
jgi:transposase InsO family protein